MVDRSNMGLESERTTATESTTAQTPRLHIGILLELHRLSSVFRPWSAPTAVLVAERDDSRRDEIERELPVVVYRRPTRPSYVSTARLSSL
jgi:hypothetical protein